MARKTNEIQSEVRGDAYEKYLYLLQRLSFVAFEDLTKAEAVLLARNDGGPQRSKQKRRKG